MGREGRKGDGDCLFCCAGDSCEAARAGRMSIKKNGLKEPPLPSLYPYEKC